MTPIFEPQESKTGAIQAAANQITNILNSLQATNTPTLLLCAGGSALEILDAIPSSALGAFLTVGMSDERYSTDEKINNFAQLMTLGFYTNCLNAGCSFIDSRVKPGQTQDQLSEEINHALKVWQYVNQNGKMICTQGLGQDGHTAGIMPYPENQALFDQTFLNTDKNVVGYNAEGKNPYPLRITVTLPFIKRYSHSVLFAVGQDKLPALKVALTPGQKLNNIPASIIQQQLDVHVFTDFKLVLL